MFLFPLFARTLKCALWRSVHTVINWTEMRHLLMCTQTDSFIHNLHYILTYLQGANVLLHLLAIHRGWINMLIDTIRNIPHKDY